MLQLSLCNENHEFVQLNELKTRFLKDSYCERPCIYIIEKNWWDMYAKLSLNQINKNTTENVLPLKDVNIEMRLLCPE